MPLRSWTLCQEIHHGGFEHPVADREHVIASGNDECLGVWHERCKRLRRARNVVLAPCGDQERHADALELVARDRLARPADASSKRVQVRSRLLREGAKRAPARIGYVRARRRLKRRRNRLC